MVNQTIALEEKLKIIRHNGNKYIRFLHREPHEGFDSESYMELYTQIYDVYTKRLDEDNMIYKTHQEIFKGYLSSVVLPCLLEKQGEFLLREFVHRWRNHKHTSQRLSLVFSNFGRCRNYLGSALNLELVGLTSFRDLIFSELKDRIRDSVLAFINEERRGKKIDRSLLKSVIEVFVDVVKEGDGGGRKRYNFYEDFEKHVIKETSLYYSQKAANWIQEFSFSEYLRIAKGCLKNEKERVSHYLCATTVEKLVKMIEHELVVQHAEFLHRKGPKFRLSLADGRLEDLSGIFWMHDRIPGGLKPIADTFGDFVREEGAAAMHQAKDAAVKHNGCVEVEVVVRKLIGLYEKLMGYVTVCFRDHGLFRKTLKQEFTVFCNERVAGVSSARIFATFFDSTLKNGLNHEEILERTVKLLAFIRDEELFAKCHTERLAKRLLSGRYSNFDLERQLIRALQQLFGPRLTWKMEGMVNDMIKGTEHQNSFQDFLMTNPSFTPEFEFSATVLTSRLWATYKLFFDITPPPGVVKCLQSFKGFYEENRKGRRLTWIYSLGNCQLLGRFKIGSIELIVSTYQATLLLLFNESDTLSICEIASRLNLTPGEDLHRLLYSLSLGKYNILKKNPDTRTISPSDTLEFNTEFTDKMQRIYIPPVLPSMGKLKKIAEDVKTDWRYVIDAAIMRIMKRRKVEELSLLVSECLAELRPRVEPDINVIKKRIESLFERDFLERDPENPNKVRYLP